jgi:hypothetical protein
MDPWEDTMRYWRIAPLAALLAMGAAVGAFANSAIAANCEGDRKLYPKNWKAVAAETPLFACRGRYISLKVFLTPSDKFNVMLTAVSDTSVYRALVDSREADRIRQQKGLYILYSEKTCFIRGTFTNPAVLSFSDGSISNGFNFLFAADRLDALDACEPIK